MKVDEDEAATQNVRGCFFLSINSGTARAPLV